MSFCSITPSRGGERKEFFEFCIKQLNVLNAGHPTNAYLMNEHPKTSEIDLVPRIREGLQLAKKDGFEWAFILEDDDAMPDNYFSRYSPYFNKVDFIGDNQTYYYNILTLRWSIFKHSGRSSLFTTAFRISALDDFKWPADNSKFLDIDIWKHARNRKKIFVDSGAIGIKHSQGLCGGKGHKMRLDHADPKMSFLKSKVSPYQFEFYKDLRLKLL